MQFSDFYDLALSVDPNASVYEDADGFLTVHTNYRIVAGPGEPLAYEEPS